MMLLRHRPIRQLRTRITPLKHRLRHIIQHKRILPITRIRTQRIRIAIDTEYVRDPLYPQIQLKRIVRRIINPHPPVPVTTRHRMLNPRVIRHLRIRRVLNVPDQSTVNLRRLNIRAIIHRMHLDARPVLPRIIHHLTDKRRHPVDR
ncbi:hypothetical protein CODIS_14930 [Candidatus Thiodiazotropha endolucinida]|uniref:Uncharacterized protein n=1 Tax=Candidatus Thiodiazotropha endolucinida TaxID=1655433 RepID=A0A7Z1AGF0_9GAMM|nr:hypothetical protein CODIS_14930 [Candidatus Thiodiazotropha endolucinida]